MRMAFCPDSKFKTQALIHFPFFSDVQFFLPLPKWHEFCCMPPFTAHEFQMEVLPVLPIHVVILLALGVGLLALGFFMKPYEDD